MKAGRKCFLILSEVNQSVYLKTTQFWFKFIGNINGSVTVQTIEFLIGYIWAWAAEIQVPIIIRRITELQWNPSKWQSGLIFSLKSSHFNFLSWKFLRLCTSVSITSLFLRYVCAKWKFFPMAQKSGFKCATMN